MQNQSVERRERRSVSLQEIETWTDVFQFRQVVCDVHHVDALQTVLTDGHPFDPLTLWQDPKTSKLIVVDGHHRLAAYKQVRWRKKVPAVIHHSGVDQARLLALKENSKTRLPLSPEERADAAWRLVCLGPEAYSKRTLAKASGVSERTVANMRRVFKDWPTGDDADELPRQWWQALAVRRGRDQTVYSDEDWQELIDGKTAQLDAQIGKALGQMASNQVQAAAAVVAKRLGRKGLEYLYEEHIHDQLSDLIDPYGLCDEDA